ncbi:MAG: cytochrome c4 [Aliidiomarina sp.]|uniref:c-type cytochrome n=1 Tax=Aliidiomarina sp. TaxID=1872439 RepID=UPI0025BAE45E|nr:c-type cytochrome [Aliidiomarina sp.]MCH8500498.1 cytochrome c4 [Aliidiomarina sp.]
MQRKFTKTTFLRHLCGGLLLLSFSTTASVAMTGDPEIGKALAARGDGSGAPCMACHAIDGTGNAFAGFPSLAGLDAGYLLKQMRDYNSGARVSAVMQPNVDGYSDEELVHLAAYFASLPPAPPASPTVSEDVLALGKKLAERGAWDQYIPPCSSCHGPDNQGVGTDFPAIAGQHANYIAQEIRAWRDGKRSNDTVQLMTGISERLTDEQIDAVAAYLSTLPMRAE